MSSFVLMPQSLWLVNGKGSVGTEALFAYIHTSLQCSFDWTADEVASFNSVDLILAADVIYDDGLTDRFLGCTLELMTHIIAVSGDSLSSPTQDNS